MKRIEINESFLLKAKINIKESLLSIEKTDPVYYQALSKQNSSNQTPFLAKTLALDYLVRQVSAKAYNLQVSSWTPTEPIESLAVELQNHGPLLIAGAFGRAHYGVPAKNLGRKINDRDIYGWSKSDPKIPGLLTKHMILLVGIEKRETRQFVYYIDSLDASDPSHPEIQRIYAMSYERLTSPENLCDTAGASRDNVPPSVGYALYKEENKSFTEEGLLEELAFHRQIVNKIGLKSILLTT